MGAIPVSSFLISIGSWSTLSLWDEINGAGLRRRQTLPEFYNGTNSLLWEFNFGSKTKRIRHNTAHPETHGVTTITFSVAMSK